MKTGRRRTTEDQRGRAACVAGRRGLRAVGGWSSSVSRSSIASAYRRPLVFHTPPAARPGRSSGGPYNRVVSVRSPLLEGLNDIQAEAVLHTEGPVLIVAGAGSGKTRALTHRIAYLIREHGVAPGRDPRDHVHEQGRARDGASASRALLGRRVAKGMWVLTFHSACARILRREHDAPRAARRSFTIYDDGDTERLIDGVLKDLDLDPEALPARAMAAAISAGEGPRPAAREFAQTRRQLLRGDDRATSTPSTSGASAPPARSTSTT